MALLFINMIFLFSFSFIPCIATETLFGAAIIAAIIMIFVIITAYESIILEYQYHHPKSANNYMKNHRFTKSTEKKC